MTRQVEVLEKTIKPAGNLVRRVRLLTLDDGNTIEVTTVLKKMLGNGDHFRKRRKGGERE
jgi:hypothetical protein